MDCGANWKLKLYPCNRWDCNTCFSKRIYWLREQAISFVFQLPVSDVYFTVLKHFKNPRDCHDMVRFIIAREKSLKSPHKSKFEYFYVIANHGFSGWHIHLISNQKFEHQAQYSESVQHKKPTALYMVKNLVMSQMADYEGVRRYGSSRLLYKQNKKTNFKSRLKLSWLIVQLALVQAILKAMLSWCCIVSYQVDIWRAVLTPARRIIQCRTEELTFRRARDDLVGESPASNQSVKVGIKGVAKWQRKSYGNRA